MGFLKMQYLPNIVSILRGLLVFPILFALSLPDYRLTFYLFWIAGLSDVLDGLLARRFHSTTRFGSIVDPIADKVLLSITVIALYWHQLIPLWLTLTIVIRDIWVLGGSLSYHYVIGRYDLKPSFPSKVNTFFQIILVLIILFDLGFWSLPKVIIDSSMYLVFISAVISGSHYTFVWGRRAWLVYKQK